MFVTLTNLVKIWKRLDSIVVQMLIPSILSNCITHFTVKLFLDILVGGQKVADQRHAYN